MVNGDGDGQPDVAVEPFALGDVEDIPAVGEALELRGGVDGDPAEPNGFADVGIVDARCCRHVDAGRWGQARDKGDAAKAIA